MSRILFSFLLTYMLVADADARADDAKPHSHLKGDRVHSDAKRFGRKVEHAFRSVGGHLQKFFTGRDTISR